jgi:DNA-binding NtrC family response regulator
MRPSPAAAAHDSAAAAATTATTAPRALLVDDEPVIRQALRRFFQRNGWEVDEAEDGAAALRRLVGEGAGRQSYAVIISDLRMPGVSGMDLYDRLARERPELLDRLILSTGDSVSAEAADFLRRSACPVLNKPFGLAELKGLVARIVES